MFNMFIATSTFILIKSLLASLPSIFLLISRKLKYNEEQLKTLSSITLHLLKIKSCRKLLGN